MLLQFNVQNFMSLKDEVVLSLNANKDKEHKDYLLGFNRESVLPSVAIYGANAAGKSNLFKALTTAIMFVRTSHLRQVNDRIGVVPFLFNEDSKVAKTKLDFKFTYKNTKYEYGFVADDINVYEEYLYEYKSSKPTIIFERTNINDYFFTSSYRNLEIYKSKNANNKLFLSTATMWNCKETKNAFMWFMENIDTYGSLDMKINEQYFVQLEKQKDNPNTKEAILNLLKYTDINISDYDFSSKEIQDKSKIMFPPGIPINGAMAEEILKTAKEYKLSTIHKVENDFGSKEYSLDFFFESDGTKLIFAYAPIILEALEKGKTIIIDEIDNSLHTMVLEYLINLFNDKTKNKNNAQIIFSTHDTNLLNLDLFRRDQIYFVEKNNQTGVSELYSLSNYSPRKTENIRRGYLQGRYGATPIILGGCR